ncbi:MAG TPA: ribosome biogenesis GTPase Der [Candidatus Doudnabacteria bacterium]|nr:ribosome biogenesis GTPase Der [Candidatus Doudnabacteria bacterium]
MNPRLPIVAIVGEPNVGKSTLLNKISGMRAAVTSTVAGTTRDRQYIDTAWNGIDFTMVDTAGITFGDKQELEDALIEQIEHAIQEADLILFVADSKIDPGTIDRKALIKFRKTKKPVVLAVNKVDSPVKFREFGGEFEQLGVKKIFPISATTGRGIGDMLDQIATDLKKLKIEKPPKPLGIPVAIVGKPNVGKSSLINHILGEKRVIVSDIPGTTRTSIDVSINIDGQDYTFIDTAGLKKKSYRQAQPDVYSVFQTFKSIRKSDVVLFVIEANETITKQDQVIAGEILDLGKGVVILVNKLDKYEGEEKELQDYVSHHFPFLWFAPVFFVSAVTGENIAEALAAIKPIYEARGKTVSQEDLDRLLAYTMEKNPPRRMLDQKVPKVHGLTQTGTHAPMFDLLVNHPAAISTQYRRYLEKQIIQKLGFWGTPIKLNLVKKQ